MTLMKKVICGLVISFCLLIPYRGMAQPPAPQLTAEVRKQTIQDLAALLPERYAYKELGPRLQRLLLQNLTAGKYDRITSAEEFSDVVTKDLRSLNSDRHLALNYSPAPPPAANNPASPVTPEQRAKRASEFNRQMNFGFEKVEFLPGNIGYVKFNYFDAYLDYSAPVVDAAMAFLRNSDAIIIDLRDNGGGSSQMVGYIEGFFFRERTLIGTSYDRLTDTSSEGFISPQPKEKQVVAGDIYLLTSKRTISAGEGLAYDLKYLRKAMVVGEVSAGAANPGRVTRLNGSFTAFIPNRHGINAVTGTNWEGTGVPVDIPCAADDALRVARIDALKKLQAKAPTSQREKFDAYLTYLERTRFEKELPENSLRQYTGEYQGGRVVSIKNGKLFYERIAEAGGQMHFIAPDVFMLAEGDVTITFKRDRTKRVVEMKTQWSLSDTPAVAKKSR